MASSEQFDFTKIINEKINELLRERGRVNVLIAGKTGVGKSTLINTVFQGKMAETGQGRPVSKDTREISKDGIPLRIIDTRGLELGADQFKESVSSLKELIKERAKKEDPSEHVHVAWICVSEDIRRIEAAESDLAKMIDELHIPVIGVITKARSDKGFRQTFQNLVPQARNVVRVRSLQEVLDDEHVLTPMGLETLIEVTMEVVPEGQRNAFAAAQKVSVKQKASRAQLVVVASATTAAAAGATPIPFSDFFVLVPIEIAMLTGISLVFGLQVTEAFLSTLVSSVLGGTAGTLGGRAIVTNILKLIPGAGSLIGGAIAATTAATLTTAIGEAYILAISRVMNSNPEGEIDPKAVAEAFASNFKISAGIEITNGQHDLIKN